LVQDLREEDEGYLLLFRAACDSDFVSLGVNVDVGATAKAHALNVGPTLANHLSDRVRQHRKLNGLSNVLRGDVGTAADAGARKTAHACAHACWGSIGTLLHSCELEFVLEVEGLDQSQVGDGGEQFVREFVLDDLQEDFTTFLQLVLVSRHFDHAVHLSTLLFGPDGAGRLVADAVDVAAALSNNRVWVGGRSCWELGLGAQMASRMAV